MFPVGSVTRSRDGTVCLVVAVHDGQVYVRHRTDDGTIDAGYLDPWLLIPGDDEDSRAEAQRLGLL